MSENTSSQNPSEKPYDASDNPDADPGQLEEREVADQPDQAEGEDNPTEYGTGQA